jgi:serine/threonine-protein kinase RsbW
VSAEADAEHRFCGTWKRSSTEGEGTLSATSEDRTVRLTIPAKPEYIALGRLALSGISRFHPLSEEVLGDLKLALTEACSNSVRHAYEGGDGVVEIVYRLHPDRLEVEVTDNGEGFELIENGKADDDLAEGGLGIAIIRALSDELEVGCPHGGGSCLRFVKHLDAPAAIR